MKKVSLLLISFLLTCCSIKGKTCVYEVYQHGVAIDRVERIQLECKSANFDLVYYKLIAEWENSK